MNALELLEAAITKLKGLRDADFIEAEAVLNELLRTIEPQIAILRAVVESVPIWVEDYAATEEEIAEDAERELALADAILGGE